MQACRLWSHTVDVTPPQAATKIMAGMAGNGWQTEWSNGGNGGNGGMAERMAEWSNGGNGYIRTIYGRHTPMTRTTTTTTHFNLIIESKHQPQYMCYLLLHHYIAWNGQLF